MDNNWFFKYLWRFNAIVIACAAIFSFISIGFFTVEQTISKPVVVQETVNIDREDNISQEYDLYISNQIDDKFIIKLTLDQSFDFKYFSKDTEENLMNVGVYSPLTGHTNWIFPTSNQLIVNYKILYQTNKAIQDRERKAIGQLFSVVERDTTQDNRLSYSDDKSVWSSTADGTKLKKIIPHIHSNVIVHYLSDDQILLSYEDTEGYKTALYDPITQTVSSRNTIEKPALTPQTQ
ncbi:hypothetical protein [Polycladidibacter stylochi]|uniref:hypothetical protein n=1 Tax=Polycladidibacter stylochi TaxID=1807766 RepID=UPI0008328EB4|nr:hypothetical protein [Pseudovibrio stylochi]